MHLPGVQLPGRIGTLLIRCANMRGGAMEARLAHNQKVASSSLVPAILPYGTAGFGSLNKLGDKDKA